LFIILFFIENKYQVLGTLELLLSPFADGEKLTMMGMDKLKPYSFCSNVLSAITQHRAWNDGQWQDFQLEGLVNAWVRILCVAFL
jgi:hypothetical protein